MMLTIESGWAFVPGPAEIGNPPLASTSLSDVALYSPEAIARAILDCPGFALLHAADPTWWDWSAGWERDDRFVILDVTLFDEPVAWGGSNIVGHCESGELLDLWCALRESFPAIWIHNDECEIHTPASFKRAMLERSAQHR